MSSIFIIVPQNRPANFTGYFIMKARVGSWQKLNNNEVEGVL